MRRWIDRQFRRYWRILCEERMQTRMKDQRFFISFGLYTWVNSGAITQEWENWKQIGKFGDRVRIQLWKRIWCGEVQEAVGSASVELRRDICPGHKIWVLAIQWWWLPLWKPWVSFQAKRWEEADQKSGEHQAPKVQPERGIALSMTLETPGAGAGLSMVLAFEGKRKDSSRGPGPWSTCLRMWHFGEVVQPWGCEALESTSYLPAAHTLIKVSPLPLVSNLRFDIDQVTFPLRVWISSFSTVVVMSRQMSFKALHCWHCMLTLLGPLVVCGCDDLTDDQVSALEVRLQWHQSRLFLGGSHFCIISSKKTNH